MTRSHHTHARPAPARDAMMQQRAALKKKKPYKIVLEAVTQEKKKLHSILTYASDAPAGFGFIPAGNPEITEWCKEQCRQRNLDVHIVSAKPKNKMHSDPEKLSHHVHRVGHHFPLDIIHLACSKFGYTYSDNSGLQKDRSHDRTNWIAKRVEAYSSRNALHSRPTSIKEDKEHTRGAIREMFPKIPEADLDSIVNHAFEEGTNRVGNAKELSLARRVQLAVVAHIRHIYTDYDKILKNGSWMEARQKVEHVSLAKLKEWRDETGEQSDEIEETFREIIVLDDDDEESSDGRSPSMPSGREPSMEIVSSRATARDLQPERYEPGLYANGRMTRSSRRTIVLRPYDGPHAVHLSDSPQQRLIHQAPSVQRRSYVQEAVQPRNTRNEMYGAFHTRPAYAYTEDSPRYMQPIAYDFSQARPRPPPPPSRDIMQEIDGRLYHLEPIRDDQNLVPIPDDHSYRAPPSISYHQRASSRAAPPRQLVRPLSHSRRNSEQDVVLPSVEREVVDLTSPRRIASGKMSSFTEKRVPQRLGEIYSPKRKALPYFVSNTSLQQDQGMKRLRPIHEETVRLHPVAHNGRAAHGAAGSSQPVNGYSEARDLPRDEYINLTSSPLRPPPLRESVPYIGAPPRLSGVPTYISPLTRYTTGLRELDITPYEHPGSAPRPPVGTVGLRVGPSGQVSAQDDRYRRDSAAYQ